MANGKKISKELEKILEFTSKRLSDATETFTQELRREIRALKQAGIGEREIFRIISADFDRRGPIFGRFVNNVKRGIVSGAMQAYRVGQDRIYGDSVKMKWVSVGSPRICIDCKERIGRIKTWNEWESVGLPASGFSVCKGYCYCQLIPTNIQVDDKVIIK